MDQGKNIVIFGVPNTSYSWRCLRYRWPNKAWPHELKEDMEQTISELSLHRPRELFWYKAECTPSGSMVVRSLGGLPGAIASRCAHEKLEFIEDMAAATNRCVLDVLLELNCNSFNMLSVDYVNEELIDRIIELNNVAQSGVYKTNSVTVDSDSFDEVDMTRNSLEVPIKQPKALEVRETNM